MQTRKCQCGCGAEVVGTNSNTGKPILYRPGHSGRGKPRVDARHRAFRATWPAREELERLLVEHGTVSGVARALGRPNSTVKHIIDRLGIDFRPTGNSMPESANRFGWSGEDHAALILGGTVARQRDNADSPFDVLLGERRIEVKTARPSLSGPGPGTLGWTFALARNRGKNDAYFCIGCNEDGLPVAYLMIPSSEISVSSLRIPVTMRSKWARFEWRPPTSG